MSQTDVLPACTAGANAGRSARSQLSAMQPLAGVLKWALKPRALAVSAAAVIYQGLVTTSQSPLAWTEAKGDLFRLAVFLPQ